MMKLTRACSLLVLPVLLAFGSTALGRTLEEVTDSYPLEKGGSISIENVNGDIAVRGWSGDQVELTYRISGGTEKALERVKVRIKSDPSHLRIETVHTKSNSWWGSDSSASVQFELRVPSGARLRNVETVNGSIEISGVDGEIEADTVNGRIKVEGLRADAKLSTVNGTVVAYLDRFTADQRVSLESVNGAVQVYLPDSADVDVRAETVHGGLKNDFGLPVEKGIVGRDLRGQLGAGGGRLSLDTVNGSISIRRR